MKGFSLTLLSKICVPLGKNGSSDLTSSRDTECGPFLNSFSVIDEPALMIGVKLV